MTFGTCNVASQTGLPIVDITSDGGALRMYMDLANRFATITPTQGSTTISVPGYLITRLVFDEQLTPVANQSSDPFTITADDQNCAVVTALTRARCCGPQLSRAPTR